MEISKSGFREICFLTRGFSESLFVFWQTVGSIHLHLLCISYAMSMYKARLWKPFRIIYFQGKSQVRGSTRELVTEWSLGLIMCIFQWSLYQLSLGTSWRKFCPRSAEVGYHFWYARPISDSNESEDCVALSCLMETYSLFKLQKLNLQERCAFEKCFRCRKLFYWNDFFSSQFWFLCK